MRKKRLLILRLNDRCSEEYMEKVRQRAIKQLKDNVIVIDNTTYIECIDYDSKEIEVKVVHKDNDVIAEDNKKI